MGWRFYIHLKVFFALLLNQQMTEFSSLRNGFHPHTYINTSRTVNTSKLTERSSAVFFLFPPPLSQIKTIRKWRVQILTQIDRRGRIYISGHTAFYFIRKVLFYLYKKRLWRVEYAIRESSRNENPPYRTRLCWCWIAPAAYTSLLGNIYI